MLYKQQSLSTVILSKTGASSAISRAETGYVQNRIDELKA